MLSMSNSLKFIILALPISLMTVGCQEDLTAVEKFGTTSVSIQAASAKMIQDIYDSCTRKEYVHIQYANARRLSAPKGDTPRSGTPTATFDRALSRGSNFNETTFTDNNSSSSGASEAKKFDFPPTKIRLKCESKKIKSQLIQNTNGVLVIYVETLGRLASSNTVTFDQNLKAIKESIVSLSTEAELVKGDQEAFNNSVTNGTNIATSLLNLIANQQRQEKLKPIIICSNDTITKFIDNLQQIIKLYYVTGVLQDEEDENLQYIETMYDLYLEALAATPDTSSEVYMSLENDYKQRIDAIESRKVAAKAYIDILEKTSLTHQALAQIFRGDMTATDQKNLCKQEGYLSPDVDPDKSLQPSTLKLTPQQIQKAQQILSNYSVSIQPSLKQLKQTFN